MSAAAVEVEKPLSPVEKSFLTKAPEGGFLYPNGDIKPFPKDERKSAQVFGLPAAVGTPNNGGPNVTINNNVDLTSQNEVDPHGLAAHTPGAKMDAGKAPIMQGVLQYFPRALRAVSMVSLVGAKKYAWKGWESVPDGFNRYSDALGRHLLAETIEGDIDADTQQLHAAQVAWNAFARLELKLRDIEAQEKKAKEL